jgi:hypothetical protein
METDCPTLQKEAENCEMEGREGVEPTYGTRPNRFTVCPRPLRDYLPKHKSRRPAQSTDQLLRKCQLIIETVGARIRIDERCGNRKCLYQVHGHNVDQDREDVKRKAINFV